MSYFPLFFEMSGRRVLVIGAGKVSFRRIGALYEAGAQITIVSREFSDGVLKMTKETRNHDDICLYKMDYRDYRKKYPPGRPEQGGFFLVLAATGDREVDRLAADDGRKGGAFVNTAGSKEESDFYFPGIAKQGGVTAGVTAGGADHHLARRMTEAVRKCLEEEFKMKHRNKVIRLGSRESALAVIQSELVTEEIKKYCPDVRTELITMKTTGDMILDRSLEQIGGKGLFVRELDRALLEGRCDLTVHSLKDMPMELPMELPLLAYLWREDKRDVLVLRKDLSSLPLNPVIGTFSKRRRLQAKKLYPGAVFKGIRGNLVTRLNKLDAGEYDALILAAAGLLRMGLKARISRYFTVEEIIPPAGQGILAIQGRRGESYPFIDYIDDKESRVMALAERAFVRTLDGGCSSPAAACAEVSGNNVFLRGLYYDEIARDYVTGTVLGAASDAEKLGAGLAITLKNKFKDTFKDRSESGGTEHF